MQGAPKITVYTQTYNGEKYLKQCIDSVLNQTYDNFEYIIADHGSTDSTWKIVEEYSKKDNRIRPYKFDHSASGLIKILRFDFNGDYYTVLDQDDWYESNYLERMLLLAEKNNADIVNTGSVFFNDKVSELRRVMLNKPFVIEKKEYNIFFPVYHWFYRQYWGKLVRTQLLKKIDLPDPKEIGISYGIDTYTSFTLLKASERICIDNMALHHYRIHSNSQSHSYMENQSFSDEFLYNFSRDFLSEYGEISSENMIFIYLVYLNALNDTLRVLLKSSFTKKKIFDEIINILNRGATNEALLYTKNNIQADIDPDLFNDLVEISYTIADTLFLYIFVNWDESIYEYSKLESIFNEYFGEISKAVNCLPFEFWSENTDLRKMLIGGDKIGLICGITEMISKKINTKKYDLYTMISVLSEGDNILALINDKMFIRKYYDIYILTVKKQYHAALEKMNEVISSESHRITETFLNFYLTLSALLERAEDFVNGKFLAAKYYLQHKNYDKCKETVNDLIEMGFENDETIINIRKQIDDDV